MLIDAVLDWDAASQAEQGWADPEPRGRSDVSAGSELPRVLVVHGAYQVRGGEDAAVEREVAALERAGVDVEALIVSNEAIRSPLDRVRTAIEAVEAPRGIARVIDAVRAFRPDVVHVHNSFPLISPAVHAAVRRLGVATVQTLHNYRLTCANGVLSRNGSPCDDCVTGSPYQAVRHGCYRGSRVGSLAVAHMIDQHRRRGTWSRDVDRFIALTDFARDRFVAAQVPAERIHVRPNGFADPGLPGTGPRTGALYVGRLSEEKGVAVLAAAARKSRSPITVIGDGPLAASLAGAPGLILRGKCDGAAVQAAMAAAAVVVVPSTCYEGLPMVIPEAFAVGTPVVVSRIGALPTLVEDGLTGLHATPGDADDLARAIDWMEAHPGEGRRMGQAARAVYLRRWTEDATTRSLLSIYAEALASRAQEA